MDLEMTAHHEAAHAVVAYLVGVRVDHLCVVEYQSFWRGICIVREGNLPANVDCVIQLAGMFGAQLFESQGKALNIPDTVGKLARYGAWGWDWDQAENRCTALLASQMPAWIPIKGITINQSLAAKYTAQMQAVRQPSHDLRRKYTRAVMQIVWDEKMRIMKLANLLVNQPVQTLAGTDHRHPDYKTHTLPTHRLEASEIQVFFDSEDFHLGGQLQVIESIFP